MQITREILAISCMSLILAASAHAGYQSGEFSANWSPEPLPAVELGDSLDLSVDANYAGNLPQDEWYLTQPTFHYDWTCDPVPQQGQPGNVADVSISYASTTVEEGGFHIAVEVSVTGTIGGPGQDGVRGTGDDESWNIDEQPIVLTHDLTVADVQITHVLDYVYANGDGYIPVQFKVEGFGNSLNISSIEGGFYVDGAPVFNGASPTAFGAGDGFGPAGNGTTDTYTAWFPPSLFGHIPNDALKITSSDCYFQVEVESSKTAGDWTVTCTSSQNQAAQPNVYGGPYVPVLTLGQPSGAWQGGWDLNHWVNATRKFIHTEKDTDAGKCWVSSFPHDCSDSDCYGPEISGDWFDDARCNRFEYDESYKLKIYLSNCDDPLLLDWHEVQARAYGEMIGTWFGVSYGTRTSTCLGGAAGRDIDMNSGDFSVNVFENGLARFQMDDVGDDNVNIGIAVASGAFSVAGTLASGPWGTTFAVLGVLTQGTGTLYDMFAEKDNEHDDRAEAAVYFVWNQKPVGGDWFSVVRDEAHGGGEFGTDSQYVRMQRSAVPTAVGRSYLAYINMNLVVNDRTKICDDILAAVEYDAQESLSSSTAECQANPQ